MWHPVNFPAWPALITALALLPGSAAGQDGMSGLSEAGYRPSFPTFPLYDILAGSPTLTEVLWHASPHVPRRDIYDSSHQEPPREAAWLFGDMALGFTSEVGIGVTDPGGAKTEMISFRRTQMISYDFNMRAGWRYAWSRPGLGFYFEAGLGYVGSPRRGNYSGADPSPIRINYFGVALFLFEGGMSVLPPAH